MNANFRNFALWVIIFLLVLALVTLFQSPAQKTPSSEITFSQLLTEVDAGHVRDVTIAGPEISGHYKDGRAFQTYAPSDPPLVDTLYKKDVAITAKPPSDGNSWLLTLLINGLPLLLFLGVWIYMSRQMQGGAGKAMGFGKSKAKLLNEAQGRVTFEDVAGVDEAKEDLQEIVEFLRDPQKFQKLGGRIPRGVLLVGPPGTGKTLTARAVAGEANVPFFTISGSDFVEMFVGVGASRVRDMFEQAKKNAPCIIFIDEIDAVGRHRGAGLGGGNDEREQTLNQLLVEMDGFEQNEGIIIIAATNRPDVLDPALLRPGRFDRQIVISNPDFIGREKILKVHVRKVPLAPDVDLKVVARGTPGFSGADLMNLVNESALLAARRGKRVVTRAEFEDARDKIMMGAERRTLMMTEEEKKLTAYHEAGHALVSIVDAGLDADPQGDDHPARPRARHGAVAARARPDFAELRAVDLDAGDVDGRPRRRGTGVRQGQGDVRRRRRHPAGDQDRPRDGDAARLLREARHGHVRREPGRSVPRLFDGPPAEHFRGDRQDDRRGSAPPRARGARDRDAHPHRAARRSRDARQGPDGVRDADGRRDRRPAAGRPAGARHRRQGAAAGAARRGARDRQAAQLSAPTPAASSRSRRPEAGRPPVIGMAFALALLVELLHLRWFFERVLHE